MYRFILPDENTVVSAENVADIIQDAQGTSREELVRAAISGTMTRVDSEDKSINLLSDPTAPFTWSTITRSSIPYVPATINGFDYHLFRDGRVEPQGTAKSPENYPPIGEYLLNNHWPYSDGNGVTIGSQSSESISNIDVAYVTQSVSDATFSISADAIRSDETLSVLLPIDGDADVTATLDLNNGGSWQASGSYNTSGWDIKKLDVNPSQRIGYGHDTLTLSISFSNVGTASWAAPALVRDRKNGYAWARALPDGRLIIYVRSGDGMTDSGIPVFFNDETFIGDGVAEKTYLFSHFLPISSLDRAVVTGRDHSQTKSIEWVYQSRLTISNSLPNRDHMPVARFSPTRSP